MGALLSMELYELLRKIKREKGARIYHEIKSELHIFLKMGYAATELMVTKDSEGNYQVRPKSTNGNS